MNQPDPDKSRNGICLERSFSLIIWTWRAIWFLAKIRHRWIFGEEGCMYHSGGKRDIWKSLDNRGMVVDTPLAAENACSDGSQTLGHTREGRSWILLLYSGTYCTEKEKKWFEIISRTKEVKVVKCSVFVGNGYLQQAMADWKNMFCNIIRMWCQKRWPFNKLLHLPMLLCLLWTLL